MLRGTDPAPRRSGPTWRQFLTAQAAGINLLAELRDRHRYAFLFVAHDLGEVRFLCQRVLVLYRGMVMEAGRADDVTARPKHP